MKTGSIASNVKDDIAAQPQNLPDRAKEIESDKDKDDCAHKAYPWWNDFPGLREATRPNH